MKKWRYLKMQKLRNANAHKSRESKQILEKRKQTKKTRNIEIEK